MFQTTYQYIMNSTILITFPVEYETTNQLCDS